MTINAPPLKVWTGSQIVLLLITCSSILEAATLSKIEELRLSGELNKALVLAEEQVQQQNISAIDKVALHLEMARIHDRIGLHHNTRPVAESLVNIDSALKLTEEAGPASAAKVELALSDYYYRAEMQDREFPAAEKHASRAIERFRHLNDGHGEADAVHRLGLIEMQRGKLAEARQLFDQSKDLDIAAGERVFFSGEYERHVGYVLYLSGEIQASAPYFERSFRARLEAGAIDASIFAAISLGGVLDELERRNEAESHLNYAVDLAKEIQSPVALARAQVALGRLYSNSGEIEAARLAYLAGAEAADSVGLQSTVRQAREGLEALRENRTE
jgi:tetratricopeptide (TPR) repeat protein